MKALNMRYRRTYLPTGETSIGEKGHMAVLREIAYQFIGHPSFHDYCVALIDRWNGLCPRHWKYELIELTPELSDGQARWEKFIEDIIADKPYRL